MTKGLSIFGYHILLNFYYLLQAIKMSNFSVLGGRRMYASISRDMLSNFRNATELISML